LRTRHAGRVNDAAVVAGEVAVGSVGAWVVEVRVKDAGAQVVGHQTVRRAAEEGERFHVTFQPGAGVLPQDRTEELMAAVRERHQEGVQPSYPLRLRVVPAAGIEEVDLGRRRR